MSSPCHIELIVSERAEPVPKGDDDEKIAVKLTRKQLVSPICVPPSPPYPFGEIRVRSCEKGLD